MVVPAYDKLTWSGVFGSVASPVEQWSFSLKLEPVENVNNEQAKAFTGRTLYTNHIAPLMGSHVILTRTRFSRHAAGGLVQRASDGSYVQADDLNQVPGTVVTSTRIPIQTAVCVSLQSNRAGPTGKGRFFLPMPSMALAADYRLTVAQADQISGACEAVLEGLPSVGKAVVVSSYGFRSLVTSLKVGRVPDTLRSRRAALVEEPSVRQINV